MTGFFVGLWVVSAFAILCVMVPPDSVVLRRHAKRSAWKLVRWRCEDAFGMMDIGPHHLMMRSQHSSVQPELSVYKEGNDREIVRGVFQSWNTRRVWADFNVFNVPRILRVEKVNASSNTCRATEPFSSRYGWYVDDTLDHLAVVTSRHRAALFHLPNDRGVWVPLHSSDFGFLGDVTIANLTLTRLLK